MEITTTELRHLAGEVDDLHRDAMHTVGEELAEVHFGEISRALSSRRQFLTRAGLGGIALTVGSAVMPIARFVPAAWAQDGPSDADLAKFAESVELAAVEAYQAAAGTGKLSAEVGAVGTLFAGHHQEHAGAFQGILGDAAGNTPNKAILDQFGPMIIAAADQAALLEIAFGLEQAAAATYLFALGALQDADNAAAVATILPVESQHAVVLATALGKPVTDFLPPFETTTEALDPAELPIG